ncbi:MAG: transcription-repair coupling factor [Phycisphaerales bacterium]
MATVAAADVSSASLRRPRPVWFEEMVRAEPVAAIAARIAAGKDGSARGAAGSSTSIVAAAIAAASERSVLLVTAHVDEAEHAADTLADLGCDVARLPALELTPTGGVDMELLGERLGLLSRLQSPDNAPQVIVSPIAALMQLAPPPGGLDQRLRVIEPGGQLDANELADWLVEGGWRRVQTIDQPGDFAVRGDIVDLFPPSGEPARIDCFGDDVERIFAVDIETMGSDRRLDRLEIVHRVAGGLESGDDAVLPIEWLPESSVAVLGEVLELNEQGRGYLERVADGQGLVPVHDVFAAIGRRLSATIDIGQFSAPLIEPQIDLPIRALPQFDDQAQAAVLEVGELAAGPVPHRVIIAGQNDGESTRVRELVAEHAPHAVASAAGSIEIETRYVHRGFLWAGAETPLAIVPYHELMHRFGVRRMATKTAGGRVLDAFVDVKPGDHVVHRDHGIAVFKGLTTLEEGPDAEEFLTLEYARGSVLHVPAAKIELVQKYIGGFSGTPELSTFGGKRWKNQKEKVSDAVRELAAEMIRLQAARSALPGIRFPADTAWQHEFEAEFPYPETEDQLAAIAAVKRDMQHEQPMDRLICGDVGFGKTEVAIRAAFKAVESGRQAAVLVPTTVLAEQHERTFRSRFRDYPFRVEALSRFKTTAEVKAVLKELAAGRVDVIVGTHRLLSKDVHFADLGLVVIDEEQRFGVEHKQRLLAFRTTADVLTLSATPIPRTLHMALLGLRDISSLQTAPLDRRAIVTEVIPFDAERVSSAIARELAREGQVFYVHNRVHDIESVADDVRRMSPPGTRVIIGHGQMPPKQLERVMLTFMRGEADVLVSTTIIESGIDIARANTMIIDDANMYGLSELHQLRGRVGRSRHRAYCYLLLPRDKPISEIALKRLRALESFSMLGSGFRIALKDLELRGAGNLLGNEQSGHIAAVGYEMYCQLLDQAVQEMRGERRPQGLDTTLEMGVNGSIPRGWIPAEARRLDAYRRVSRAATIEELGAVEEALRSAYGDLPKRTRVLFELAELRIHAAGLGIRSIKRQPPDVIFRTARPKDLESGLERAKGSKRLIGSPENGLATLYYRPPETYLEPRSLLRILRERLRPADAVTSTASAKATSSSSSNPNPKTTSRPSSRSKPKPKPGAKPA